MQTQVLFLCAVLMTASGLLGGAEQSGRGLANDKAVAAFYQPDEVQSVYLRVADNDLKRMLAALPELIEVPASFRWRDVDPQAELPDQVRQGPPILRIASGVLR